MTSTFSTRASDAIRRSTDTDQRHLLADSVTASETSSILTDITGNGGDKTPRAASPSRGGLQPQDFRPSATPRHQSVAVPQSASANGSYRGFSSEAAYLAALRTWAEGRQYTEPTETTLLGYYGATTMAEYASRPAVLQPLGLRKKWKAMRAGKQDRPKLTDERRATIA